MEGSNRVVLKKALYTSPGVKGTRGFEDLECYQLALDVMVNAHEMAKLLPAEEKYDLVSQVRKSSKSSPANIAEGYGRYHYLDSLKFYSNARGSLNETLSHFITAQLFGYIEQPYFEALYHLTKRAEKALNGYMNYVRTQRAGHELYGVTLRENPVEYEVDR
ncbi:MAG: four helix bundle protein [Caldilinea sp. CFX5]|nr:four helix bundle protein [Caldilinea sp. CFX5]